MFGLTEWIKKGLRPSNLEKMLSYKKEALDTDVRMSEIQTIIAELKIEEKELWKKKILLEEKAIAEMNNLFITQNSSIEGEKIAKEENEKIVSKKEEVFDDIIPLTDVLKVKSPVEERLEKKWTVFVEEKEAETEVIVSKKEEPIVEVKEEIREEEVEKVVSQKTETIVEKKEEPKKAIKIPFVAKKEKPVPVVEKKKEVRAVRKKAEEIEDKSVGVEEFIKIMDRPQEEKIDRLSNFLAK